MTFTSSPANIYAVNKIDSIITIQLLRFEPLRSFISTNTAKDANKTIVQNNTL